MARKAETFADRAKKIMKKYERRPGDNATMESRNRELQALKEEQEAIRKDMAQEAFSTLNSLGYGGLFAYGGKIRKYNTGGPFQTVEEEKAFQDFANAQGVDTGGYGWGPKSQAAYNQLGDIYTDYTRPLTTMNNPTPDTFDPIQGQLAGADPGNLTTEQQIQGIQMANATLGLPNQSDQSDQIYQGQQFNPYVAAAQGAGDALGLAYSFQKQDPIEYGRLGFKETDNSEALRSIDRSVATGRMNLRDIQRSNPNAALATQVAGNAALAGQAGQSRANVIQQSQNADILRKQQIDQANIQLRMIEDSTNRAAQDQRKMAQVGHLQNLGQLAAGAYGDQRRMNSQDMIVNMMNTGNYRYITDENGNMQIVPITS